MAEDNNLYKTAEKNLKGLTYDSFIKPSMEALIKAAVLGQLKQPSDDNQARRPIILQRPLGLSRKRLVEEYRSSPVCYLFD